MWACTRSVHQGLLAFTIAATAAAFVKKDAASLAGPDSQTFCSWAASATCVPSFAYQDQLYTGCSTADSTSGTAWCSHTETYSGDWSSCSWKCLTTPESLGSPSMPTTNSWLPSSEELGYLQSEATSAAARMAETRKRQEELRQQFWEADRTYQQAADAAAEAKRKAALAKAYREAEKRRVAALPSLARAAQEDAIWEHEQRVAAETQLEELRRKTAAAKDNDGQLDSIRAALTKQRLINRVRAAEDARIMAAAKDAATKARLELKQRALNVDAVKEAALAASAARDNATLLAGQIVANATAELTAQVAKATSAAAQREQEVALAVQEYEFLKQQAERSAANVTAAQKQAFGDRAMADAALNRYQAYGVVAAAMGDKAEDSSSTAADAVDKVNSTREKASVTFSERDEAEKEAFATADGAVEALKAVATKAGKTNGLTEYAADISDLSPNSFLSGVAAGMKKARSSA